MNKIKKGKIMFDFEGQYANEIVDNLQKKLETEGKNIDNYFYDKEKYSTAFILALSSENTEYLKALKLLNFEKYGTNFIIPKEIFNNIIMKDNRIEYFTLINELGLFNNNYTKSRQDVFSYLIDNNKSEIIDDLLEADVQPLFSGQKNYLLTMIKNKDIVNFKKYMEKDFYVNIEDIKDIFIEVDINSKEDVDVLTEMLQLISNNSYMDKKEENFLASKLFTNMLKKMDLETLKLFNKTYPINDFNMIQNYSYFKNNSEICNSLSKNDCEILMFLKEISSMKYILSISMIVSVFFHKKDQLNLLLKRPLYIQQFEIDRLSHEEDFVLDSMCFRAQFYGILIDQFLQQTVRIDIEKEVLKNTDPK